MSEIIGDFGILKRNSIEARLGLRSLHCRNPGGLRKVCAVMRLDTYSKYEKKGGSSESNIQKSKQSEI
jgi:hypothetical protein